MKSLFILVSTIIVSFLFVACDPTFDVDYKVTNETEEALTVIVDHNLQRSDTSIIASGTSLIFFNDFGIGPRTHEYLDALTLLPVELSLFNNKGESYNKNAQDISNWRKIYPPKKNSGMGIVELRVRAEDF